MQEKSMENKGSSRGNTWWVLGAGAFTVFSFLSMFYCAPLLPDIYPKKHAVVLEQNKETPSMGQGEYPDVSSLVLSMFGDSKMIAERRKKAPAKIMIPVK